MNDSSKVDWSQLNAACFNSVQWFADFVAITAPFFSPVLSNLCNADHVANLDNFAVLSSPSPIPLARNPYYSDTYTNLGVPSSTFISKLLEILNQ